MRQFLIAVVVLSVVVFLALWLVINYRNQVSYNSSVIDSRATRVVKVDVGSLTRNIGWNAFWNPSFYADGESSEVMEKKRMANTGLGTVSNVFLFQIGNQPFWSNVTFGVLAVGNAEVFTQFLQTELGMTTGRDEQGHYGRHERVVVRYDDRQAVFALGSLKRQGEEGLGDTLVMERLGAYMAGEHLVNVKESLFFNVLDQPGHVVSAGEEQVSIDFLEGEITFSYVTDSSWALAEPTEVADFSDSSLVRVSGNVTELLPAGRTFSLGDFSLDSDSLKHYAKGEVVGEWRGMAIQTDSVVAWTYNEDFEMQETVELVERSTPDLYLSIRAETDGLQHYLQRQGILDSTSAEVNFPLFKTLWQQEDDWLTIYTQSPDTVARETDNRSPLYVEADIHAIKQQTTIPKIHPYLAPFRSLAITAGEESQGTVLRGRIKMEDNTVNSLMQILVRKESAE